MLKESRFTQFDSVAMAETAFRYSEAQEMQIRKNYESKSTYICQSLCMSWICKNIHIHTIYNINLYIILYMYVHKLVKEPA